MLILPKTQCIKKRSEEDPESIGVHAIWIKGNKIATSIEEADTVGSEFFAVKNAKDKGEYYIVPEGVTGVIVQSEKDLAAVAAWRKQNSEGEIEHDGPWQVYGEQEGGTIAYHFLGDTQTVFLGLV